MDILAEVTKKQLKSDLPVLKPGQTVRVHQKIKETTEKGERERVQIFEGMIIALKNGRGAAGSMTVRKIASGIGVERIFPLHAPFIKKFEVVKEAKVNRAKLYFMRRDKTKRKLDEKKVEAVPEKEAA